MYFKKTSMPDDEVKFLDYLCENLDIKITPLWKKTNLTIKEASQLFGIGTSKLYELTEDENCNFVIFVGSKRLIKREKFAQYLESAYSI